MCSVHICQGGGAARAAPPPWSKCANAIYDYRLYLISCMHFTDAGDSIFKVGGVADVDGSHAFCNTFYHAGQGLSRADFDKSGDASARKIVDGADPLHRRGYLCLLYTSDAADE